MCTQDGSTKYSRPFPQQSCTKLHLNCIALYSITILQGKYNRCVQTYWQWCDSRRFPEMIASSQLYLHENESTVPFSQSVVCSHKKYTKLSVKWHYFQTFVFRSPSMTTTVSGHRLTTVFYIGETLFFFIKHTRQWLHKDSTAWDSLRIPQLSLLLAFNDGKGRALYANCKQGLNPNLQAADLRLLSQTKFRETQIQQKTCVVSMRLNNSHHKVSAARFVLSQRHSKHTVD